MTLRIISAEDILFEGDVKSATLPGTMGKFTVLPRHASLVSTLTPGSVEYVLPDASRHSEDIEGGIVEVNDDVISVCVY